MRLRIGLGPFSKALAAVATLLVMAGGSFMLALVHGWIAEPGGGPDVGGPPEPLKWFITAIAACIVLGAAGGLLHSLTYGARLDGTRATVTGPFGSHSVDLARATQLWFEEKTERAISNQGDFDVHLAWQVPLLCATDGRDTVKIPLSSGGRRLPRRQLEALGGAIHAGHDLRDRADTQGAMEVVHVLFAEAARL